MRLVNFSKEIIRNDSFSFSLDEKIEPNFYNAGDVVAFIEGVAIPPGSSFQSGVSNAITRGSLDITFGEAINESEGINKKVICFFGKLILEESSEKTNCE